MLHTIKLFPLSHLRGGSISAQDKEIQVHMRMLTSSSGLPSIQLLCSQASLKPHPPVQAQLLPHWNVLITVPCECLQRSAASLHWQAELQAGGGQCGTVASAQLNWRVWNGALCSLSFELNYSATQFRHKSVHLHCSRGKVMLQEQRYIWI